MHCHEFEDQYGEELKKQVQEGNIELEIRNLTFLDQNSPTQYSARTANAAYAVANQVSADKFLDFQKELFSHQGTGDLNNQQIDDALAALFTVMFTIVAIGMGLALSRMLTDKNWLVEKQERVPNLWEYEEENA